ncbi:MAG: contact-dependent growth inhibition system immunity protein [Chloroflexota bacterium]|nr:contact-dependent growth inhibition system immunity protein [Chloroflexota bacterium]
MKLDFDRSKTLEELEGVVWGEPTYPSNLVLTIYSLRKKPLQEFSAEDLRVVIGQHLFLPFVIPLALELLEKDLMVSGYPYQEGVLLSYVAQVEPRFWREDPDMKDRFEALLERELASNFTYRERIDAASNAYRRFRLLLRVPERK